MWDPLGRDQKVLGFRVLGFSIEAFSDIPSPFRSKGGGKGTHDHVCLPGCPTAAVWLQRHTGTAVGHIMRPTLSSGGTRAPNRPK